VKAIIINEPGGTDKFIYTEIEKPNIKADEVLVQVKAISINPVDVKTRAGKGVYGRIKEESPIIDGWDISGVVVEAGSETHFKAGDEVFGMVNFPGHGKAYAEYVAAPANQLALKPANISHTEAAAATLASLTAYQALITNAKVQAGQQVLVHAAAGGVGHYTVQIAKYLGAHVVGTSSSKNRDFVMSLGADEHIDYQGYDWANSPYQFDFILDAIGAENIDKSLEVAKPGSTLISIPSGLSGDVTEKAKAKGVNGYFFLVSSNGEDMTVLADWLQKGIIKSHVPQTFAFEEMGKAHQQVESGRTVGKVVVVV
jgi:NADPH:quinone reductase-like Zn-dependent oxidoreductase